MTSTLLDLLLPNSCAGCGAVGVPFCRTCAAQTARPRRHVPRPEPPGLPPLWTAGTYTAGVRAAVLAYKERGRRGLAVPLGQALGRAAERAAERAAAGSGQATVSGPERTADRSRCPPGGSPGDLPGDLSGCLPGCGFRCGSGCGCRRRPGRRSGGGFGGRSGCRWPGRAAVPVCLVPVPSRRSVARSRGGDHVRRLARIAAGELRRAGVPAGVGPVLRMAGRPRDSAGLNAAARAANLAGAFVADPGRAPPAGATLIVVDDVITTGATLSEAARVLARAGLPVAGAAVVAATPRLLPVRGRSRLLHPE